MPAVAREAADELARAGAEAIVLVGSHARGDAGSESDVDLLAVGPETFWWRLQRRDGRLVSTSSQPSEAYREAFRDPGSVCTVVPGWREAVPLHDPEGTGASLIEEADGWTWEPLERRCDAWVAEEITPLTEEVHKLVAALRDDNRPAAAVNRSLLALRLAPILAVHLRILYGSENRLWDLVGTAMGEEWRRTQSAAFGLDCEPFDETCKAALRLYGLAADETHHLLDDRQRRVVRRGREIAGLADGRKLNADS